MSVFPATFIVGINGEIQLEFWRPPFKLNRDMKTTLTLILFLLLASLGLSQDARYETVTGTNSITITDYESGELISVLSTNIGNSTESPFSINVTKDGFVFSLRSAASYLAVGSVAVASSGVGDIIRGPATFSVRPGYGGSVKGFTIKITPVSFPPNQTLIVVPGTNQVQISMESSTNLVNWATATNGVYGSPNEARFFRLKMTNLQP